MKIQVDLSNNSIKDAIKKLENVKKLLPIMRQELLIRSCEKIVEYANNHIRMIDVGSAVKQDIIDSWQPPEIKDNKAILRNISEKAVFIEFGVGIVGKSKPHPRASEENYNYDVDEFNGRKGRKHKNRSWTFAYTDESEIDISVSNFDYWDLETVTTKGQVGFMFLFNAIEDFKINNCAKQIWQDIKKEYLG